MPLKWSTRIPQFRNAQERLQQRNLPRDLEEKCGCRDRGIINLQTWVIPTWTLCATVCAFTVPPSDVWNAKSRNWSSVSGIGSSSESSSAKKSNLTQRSLCMNHTDCSLTIPSFGSSKTPTVGIHGLASVPWNMSLPSKPIWVCVSHWCLAHSVLESYSCLQHPHEFDCISLSDGHSHSFLETRLCLQHTQDHMTSSDGPSHNSFETYLCLQHLHEYDYISPTLMVPHTVPCKPVCAFYTHTTIWRSLIVCHTGPFPANMHLHLKVTGLNHCCSSQS